MLVFRPLWVIQLDSLEIYVWIYENRVNNRIMWFFFSFLVACFFDFFISLIFAFAMTAACNSYVGNLSPHVY